MAIPYSRKFSHGAKFRIFRMHSSVFVSLIPRPIRLGNDTSRPQRFLVVSPVAISTRRLPHKFTAIAIWGSLRLPPSRWHGNSLPTANQMSSQSRYSLSKENGVIFLIVKWHVKCKGRGNAGMQMQKFSSKATAQVFAKICTCNFFSLYGNFKGSQQRTDPVFIQYSMKPLFSAS